MSKMREHVLLNSSNGPHIHTVIRPFEYDKLPCSPYSKDWKGSAKIRKIFRDMLKVAGYGKAGSKKVLGVGAPPYGWPKKYDWKDYKGSTRSTLTIPAMTDIIVSMLRAAGFDPATHVKDPDEQEIEIEPENNNNQEFNLEETFPEEVNINVNNEEEEREDLINIMGKNPIKGEDAQMNNPVKDFAEMAQLDENMFVNLDDVEFYNLPGIIDIPAGVFMILPERSLKFIIAMSS